jgi:hypothetical protein
MAVCAERFILDLCSREIAGDCHSDELNYQADIHGRHSLLPAPSPPGCVVALGLART